MRRFFRNAEQTAAIINVDVHLIKRIYVVLCTLSSGFMIDADKFKRLLLRNSTAFYTTLSLVLHAIELAQNLDTWVAGC